MLLHSTDRRADRTEFCLPPRKRLCIAQGPRYEVGESSSAPRPTRGFRTDYGFVATLDEEIRRDPDRDVGYGITDIWDEMLVGMPGALVTDDTELGRRMSLPLWLGRTQTRSMGDLMRHMMLERSAGRDCSLASSRPRSTGIACGDTETDEYTADTGVADALAARDAERSMNGDDSHNLGTGVRRQAPPAREMFKESDKIEKYVDGLPDMIHGSVMASKPKTMQDAIEFATELMDKKIRLMLQGLCNRVGHLDRDCRSTANDNTANNQRGTRAGQKPTCYECGAQGHFKRDCPKLKNNNRDNQGGNGNAPAKVYAVGHAGTNPDSNIVTDLMPIELGSFDVIIGMDWLEKYQAVIKYMLKGRPFFLAHVTKKETEDKSEKKRLEDVPIVRNFPEVFPKDLPVSLRLDKWNSKSI
ncbi:putative reverse transcriptase domain-containing protein [Tanacetum coccineum]|uniref:Reverse transcriptase domain-containing protein n=1 Tax=Tanacetum coccineum TaxID=301880 RepID=A0ABQ5CIJ5_9ASTR